MAKEEVKKIQSVPLTIGQFSEMVDENHGIVSKSNTHYYVRILSTINRELLKPSASVALRQTRKSIACGFRLIDGEKKFMLCT